MFSLQLSEPDSTTWVGATSAGTPAVGDAVAVPEHERAWKNVCGSAQEAGLSRSTKRVDSGLDWKRIHGPHLLGVYDAVRIFFGNRGMMRGNPKNLTTQRLLLSSPIQGCG